jgi:hypothetical protein
MVSIGELYVVNDALCDDDITAVLHGESDVETKVLQSSLPVEEQGYFDPVTISVENGLRCGVPRPKVKDTIRACLECNPNYFGD